MDAGKPGNGSVFTGGSGRLASSGFSAEQMLSRYERGWEYRKLFSNLEGEELNFLKVLASRYNSWLQACL